MDKTVEEFYMKNPGEGYAEMYDLDHGPRLDYLIEKYDLYNQLKDKSVVDFGGGLGFLGKRLSKETDYYVFDGAYVNKELRVCDGNWIIFDLDKDIKSDFYINKKVDVGFCLETIEHTASPYNCIEQLKNIVKENGDIYISCPTEEVWHNTPYPSLFWPKENFIQWLGQMALPIIDFYVYEPKVRGWPAYQYKCRNAPWTESRMLYPKTEAKFYGKTPLEYTNL